MKDFHRLALALGLAAIEIITPLSQFRAVAAEITPHPVQLKLNEGDLIVFEKKELSIWDRLEELIMTAEGQKQILELSKNDPVEAIKHCSQLILLGQSDLSKQVLLTASTPKLVQAVKDNPDIGFRFFDIILDTPIAESIIAILTHDNPRRTCSLLIQAKPELYGDKNEKIKNLIRSAALTIVQQESAVVGAKPHDFLTTKFGNQYTMAVIEAAPSQFYTISEKILAKQLTPDELNELKKRVKNSCIDGTKKQNNPGAFGVIAAMNNNENEPQQRRMEVLSDFTATDIFFLISVSESGSAHRKTYYDLHDKLHEAMKKESLSPTDLLKDAGIQKSLTDFTRTVSRSGLFNEFFQTCRTQTEKNILARAIISIPVDTYLQHKAFPSEKEKNNDPLQTATDSSIPESAINTGIVIADVLNQMDDPEAKTSALNALENVYKNTMDTILRTTIGCAVSTHFATSDRPTPPHPFFIEQENVIKQFPVSPTMVIPENNLFKDGECLVLMRFFKDKENETDSRDSYNSVIQHFKSDWKQKAGWHVEKLEKYSIITNNNNPERRIRIIANNPEKSDNYNSEVKVKFFTDKIPNVTVQRGHGIRILELNLSDQPSALAIIGGCNGYAVMSEIVKIFDKTPVLVTKGVGMQLINNTSVSAFLEIAQDTGEIDLQKAQEWLSKVYTGPGLDDYITPNKNVFSVMQSSLKSALQTSMTRDAPSTDLSRRKASILLSPLSTGP